MIEEIHARIDRKTRVAIVLAFVPVLSLVLALVGGYLLASTRIAQAHSDPIIEFVLPAH